MIKKMATIVLAVLLWIYITPNPPPLCDIIILMKKTLNKIQIKIFRHNFDNITHATECPKSVFRLWYLYLMVTH